MASIVRTARFLTRTRLSPLGVSLRRPRRPAPDRFEAFFGCPVTYGAEAYVLAFDPADVHRPLPTSCVEAARAADSAVADYLERVRPAGCAADAARQAVVDLLDRGERPSLPAMAKAAAERLYNTPAVARASYLHPAVAALAGEEAPTPPADPLPRGLSAAEGRLLALLEDDATG